MSPLPRTPHERFAAIIDLLCRTVAARIAGGRLAGPLILLIWRRLSRMGVRFAAIAARHEAGTLPAPRRRPRAPRPARPRPPPLLPRGVAWLLRLVPEAAGGASQLQHLLADAEMAALIAAAPQAGRILRPLCRMLGLRPPAVLALPPRPARPPAASCRGPAAPHPARPPQRPRRTAPAPAPAPRACGPPIVPA